MRINNILMASLLVSLSACQPEAPAPKTDAPAVEPPPTTPAAQPVAPAPAQVMQPAPAPASTSPAMTAEPAPAAAAATPETKPAAILSEADAMQLAKKSNCLACHSTDKKIVGPSFKDVAAKYRGDAGAEGKIADKIAKGGSGVWGVVVMPPSPQVSEADRKALARFVLSLK